MMKQIITLVFIIFTIGIIILTIYNMDTTKADSVTLANTVIAKWQTNGSPTSWSSGASGIYKTNGHEYRYVGANVDNWVSFNNDMYRIIGVFDDNSHGVTGEYLVKLISDKKLIASTWGVYNDTTNYTTYSGYNNNWLTGNLNLLLNTYYMNPNDTSPYGTCENLLYYSSDNNYKTKDCSKIKKYGIQSQELRNYIQPVTWYLIGHNSNSYSKQSFYNCERSDNTTLDSSCNKSSVEGAATKIENTNIGLMYVSDYLYASGNYSSSSTSYAEFSYAIQNWLYNGWEWTITPRGSNATVSFSVGYDGKVKLSNTNTGAGSRPSFYLKSSVYVTGGNGSYSNPYTIACDDCNPS